MTLLCWVPATLALSLSAQQIPSDYKAYFTAADEARAGKQAEALEALKPLWSMNPASPLEGHAAMIAGQAHLILGRPEEAAAILQKYSEQLPQPRGLLLTAKALEAAGNNAVAADLHQQVFYKYPLSKEAEESAAALTRLTAAAGGNLPPAMPDAVFERAETLRRAGKAVQAKSELVRAAGGFGGRDRELALVRAEHGSYARLRALTVKTPEANAERLYLMHAAARRGGHFEQAESALKELERRYPKSKWTMEALISWGNHHLLQNNVTQYVPLYTRCAERFSSDPQAAYCHWKVTWAAWMRRDPKAKKLMAEHLERFPDTDKAGAALYFLRRYTLLVERYPFSYYSTLVREKITPASVAWIDPAVFSASDGMTRRVERALQLERAGFADWAEFELKNAAGEQPFVAAMAMAEMMAKRGSHDRALRYIKSLATGYLYLPYEAAPKRFWQLAFPLPYASSVIRNSRARQLDPDMVAALIRQESEFNPKAVSRARAYGLTQVLPSTGRQLSRRVGIRRFSTSMLYQPEINLKLGTYYLKTLLDRNGGQWEAALAAYNAGQSRVNEWMSWYDYKEPAEFIETIPFTETRGYVQIVLRNADVYRRLYGQGLRTLRASAGD